MDRPSPLGALLELPNLKVLKGEKSFHASSFSFPTLFKDIEGGLLSGYL